MFTLTDISLQLYTQKGSHLNKVKALDVTPTWRYTTTTDEAQLKAGLAIDGEFNFSLVST